MLSLLTTRADLDWLTDVHGIPTTRAVVAVIVGHEDWPDRVELYRLDDYRTCYAAYALTDDGHAPAHEVRS